MIESSENLDMDWLLICAIAERVALVMDDATRSLSRYYEYHAIAQGGTPDWHYWCMVKASLFWKEAVRAHGELHTLDAAARIFDASEGALGWCMTSQPFPDA